MTRRVWAGLAGFPLLMAARPKRPKLIKPPVLKPFRPLVEAAPAVEYGKILKESDLKRPTYASRVWVADVNGDGKLDLIVGDSVTLIEPAKGLTEAEMKKKQSELAGRAAGGARRHEQDGTR